MELLTFKIPMLAKKHEQVNDKGLYWERIKMEIRAFTIAFQRRKLNENVSFVGNDEIADQTPDIIQ